MNNYTEKVIEKLSERFKKSMSKFITLSPAEKCKKIAENFRGRSPQLAELMDELAELYKSDAEESTKNEIEEWFNAEQENFTTFSDIKLQFLIDDLPSILYVAHILFENTYSNLKKQVKKELLAKRRNTKEYQNLKSPLTTPKLRKEAFLKLLDNYIEDKDEWTKSKPHRLRFLALNNRFQMIIKKLREEKKKLLKVKKRGNELEKLLNNKYKIPPWCNDWINESISPRDLAFQWAKKEMRIEQTQDYEGDAFLMGKFLTKVRKEANDLYLAAFPNERGLKKKLIGITNYDSNLFFYDEITTLEKKQIEELCHFNYGFKNNKYLYFI